MLGSWHGASEPGEREGEGEEEIVLLHNCNVAHDPESAAIVHGGSGALSTRYVTMHRSVVDDTHTVYIHSTEWNFRTGMTTG